MKRDIMPVLLATLGYYITLLCVQGRMKRDIMPVLLAYLGCGVILAILQIVAIVLSAAYSAALARRARREEERYAAVKQG